MSRVLFLCAQLKLFLIKLFIHRSTLGTCQSGWHMSAGSIYNADLRVNRIFGRVNISTCAANIRKLFLDEEEDARGPGTNVFSRFPIAVPVNRADRGGSGGVRVSRGVRSYP